MRDASDVRFCFCCLPSSPLPLFFFLVVLVPVSYILVYVYILFSPLDFFYFVLSLLVPPLPFKNVLRSTHVLHVFLARHCPHLSSTIFGLTFV